MTASSGLRKRRTVAWTEAIAARLGVPLPPITLSQAKISTHRRTEDVVRTPPPPGHELQLLIRGRLIDLGRFIPGRVQTMTRDWDDADADGAITCFNEALQEPVRWTEQRVLDKRMWEYTKWTFEQAAQDWLHDLLRRHIAGVFSYDRIYIPDADAQASGSARIATNLHVLSNVLYPVWMVITNLIRERVPLADRSIDLLAHMIDIVRESNSLDVPLTILRLREHVSNDLCHAFADTANQIFVLLLEEADEQWLASKLHKTPVRMSLDKLTPEEALRIVAAVRDRFEAVARNDHAWPVLVYQDDMRAPLFDMLQRHDHRMFVLSPPELSPDVRLISRGVIPRISPGGEAG